MTYKIFENGVEINTIESGEEFVTSYCAKNSYTYEAVEPEPEPELPAPPSQEERITALETNKADKADIYAVWDELDAAYREGVDSI